MGMVRALLKLFGAYSSGPVWMMWPIAARWRRMRPDDGSISYGWMDMRLGKRDSRSPSTSKPMAEAISVDFLGLPLFRASALNRPTSTPSAIEKKLDVCRCG